MQHGGRIRPSEAYLMTDRPTIAGKAPGAASEPSRGIHCAYTKHSPDSALRGLAEPWQNHGKTRAVRRS